MKIEITLQQFSVLKDIFQLLKGINGATSIKMHIEVDGWLGKGTADYNRHEHDAKIRIELPDFPQKT